MTDAFGGRCFCGKVKVEVRGAPLAAGYCHCVECRAWHSAPVNAWAVWPKDAFKIVEGQDDVRHDYNHHGSDGPSERMWCSHCGGSLGNQKPKIGMTVVYAMTLRDSAFEFQPTLHIHYKERVLDMKDGLPKFADEPKAFGGSDERIPEPTATAWHGG